MVIGIKERMVAEMTLKERIEEKIYSSIRRATRHCPNCNQEFLYEQSIDVPQATTDILKAIREGLPEKEEKCQADDNDCLCNDHIKPPLDNPFREGYNQAIEDMKEVIG